MRDSDIDSLSADGAQEPWPTDSAEALLREALERLERVLSHPASSAHWDTGPNGGEIAGAMVQARAALQASAPPPADIHDLPGHKAHECRICGQWTERAAAEGSGLRPGYCECGRRIGHP